jgi:predicted ATPase/class 3 adenylate cyclase
MPDPANTLEQVLPTGTLTFLFTDIEASTRAWEQHPEAMGQAHARHGQIVLACVARHGGTLVRARGEGDSTFCVFPDAAAALAAACDFQRALGAEPWPDVTPIRVRAALHTGAAPLRDGDYNASDVNRCARLRAIAHGGQTLLSEATRLLVCDRMPPCVGLRDLGVHRLRDLSRPERVYQLLHPDLLDAFPPLASLEARLTNLPVQMTSFIGREREIGDVRERLNRHRLLTLTGPGGGGKTRLAVQVGAELLDDYPDGVWLVELAGLTDPALVPQAVAQALAVREQPGRIITGALAECLRSKSLLLVLDNCEHLAPSCAALIQTLLRECPHLRVLATSRHTLGLTGTGHYPVPPLSLPPSPEELMQSEAARLFLERAASACPIFAQAPVEAPTIAQICRRLNGIPLAIELAAAWADVLSLSQIAARLDDRFRLLTRGNTAAHAHHQTLRATIDWSYKLLSSKEKTLFACLSVFVGGWTLEAAESVCAGKELCASEVLTFLSRLADKSLISIEENGAERRYYLLETIREYSREKLARMKAFTEIQMRHCDWFLAFAQQGQSCLSGPDQAQWLDRLAADQENFRGALDQAHCESAEKEALLAASLISFWQIRGYFKEGLSSLERTLQRREALSENLCTAVLNSAGLLAWARGDYELAARCYEDCLAIAQQSSQPGHVAAILNNLGNLKAQQGDMMEALAYLEQSLSHFRAAQDETNVALTLCNLGALLIDRGEYEAAVAPLEESLTALRRSGNAVHLANALQNLACVNYLHHEYLAAEAHLRECLTLRRATGDRQGLAIGLHTDALIQTARGDYQTAAHLLGEADAIHAGLDLPPPQFDEEDAACREQLLNLLGETAYQLLWEQGYQTKTD